MTEEAVTLYKGRLVRNSKLNMSISQYEKFVRIPNYKRFIPAKQRGKQPQHTKKH